MAGVTKHANSNAALRRARFAAWTVFLSMAGTTIAFQVYHSLKVGQMPQALAVLFGVTLLLISVCILEVIAEWTGSPFWAKVGAYAIMAGSMLMSAGATGEVVKYAAPPHMSLLFGFLMDGAALLSVHFLLSGPRPQSKTEEREQSALLAAFEAEQAAVLAEREARANAEAELGVARRELADAVAQAQAETARAERLDRKLAAAAGAKGTRSAGAKKPATSPRKAAGAAPETELPDDFDAQTEALRILAAEPDISGAKLAERVGRSERWGQMFKSNLAKAAPKGPDAGDSEA